MIINFVKNIQGLLLSTFLTIGLLTGQASRAEDFSIGQYGVIPKCQRTTCFKDDQGHSYKLYCVANGYESETKRDRLVAMPLQEAGSLCYCLCTIQFLGGGGR